MVAVMPTLEDRLAARETPRGSPVMHQTWGKLLFMHWPISAELLRPKIPSRLEIDTWDGTAWIAITPFTLWQVRANGMPAIPGLDAFHECNVRTYVHLDGVPGVWFLSLDASKAIPVLAARMLYALNYLKAHIDLCQVGQCIHYALQRPPQNSPGADLELSWNIGEVLPAPEPARREFFFVERYCLYAGSNRALSRARIWHVPWVLRSATLNSFRSTLLESHELPTPEAPPILHYAEERAVLIYAPQEV
jgi:uncharacterized protein YqjF (DUF2071 family)